MKEIVLEEKEPKKAKISKILISQPEPQDASSPYLKLASQYNIKIDFKQFIQIDKVDYKSFRKQKVDFLDYTGIIFTSKNAIDQYFTLCKEAKVEMPAETKYFCVTEQTANYLQKYIVLRKRKIFVGGKRAEDLFDLILKHKAENFLYPCSDVRNNDIPAFLEKNGLKYKEAIIYKTVAADLKEIDIYQYDILAFFSPSGVNSLMFNFPEFKQGKIVIAAFGPTTAKAVIEAGLKLSIEAPTPTAPSMTGAIEMYIKTTKA